MSSPLRTSQEKEIMEDSTFVLFLQRVKVSFVNFTQSPGEETLSEGLSIRLALGQVGGRWEGWY